MDNPSEIPPEIRRMASILRREPIPRQYLKPMDPMRTADLGRAFDRHQMAAGQYIARRTMFLTECLAWGIAVGLLAGAVAVVWHATTGFDIVSR